MAIPDEVIAHEPGCCGGCGKGLSGAPEIGREHQQVFALPPITPRVIEHQLIRRRCGCGIATTAAAPAGVNAAVQYGPRMTAVIVYLYLGQFLARKRTAAALAELSGTPVSMGTVATMTSRAAGCLGGLTDWVCDRLVAAEVVHFDETGLRVAGKLRWVLSAFTGKYLLITVHDPRHPGPAGCSSTTRPWRSVIPAAPVVPSSTSTAPTPVSGHGGRWSRISAPTVGQLRRLAPA